MNSACRRERWGGSSARLIRGGGCAVGARKAEGSGEEGPRGGSPRLREEADRLAALVAAESALVKLAGARETVTGVLGEQAGQRGEMTRSAVAGSTVPQRGKNAVVEVLAPEYQQILRVLAVPEASGGIRVKQILAGLGWETTPTRIGGVRSRVKPLAARGWATEVAPHVFASAYDDGVGCRGMKAFRRRPASRPVISMVIDHSTNASCRAGRVS